MYKMIKDSLYSPSNSNPKGYTSTSWDCDSVESRKSEISIENFDCPIFWEKQHIEYFIEPITIGIFREDKFGFARSWGGDARREGCWIHNRLFETSEEAKGSLNLKGRWGNTAETLTLAEIKRGARYIKGGIKEGKGEQLYIHSEDVKNDLVIFHQDNKLTEK